MKRVLLCIGLILLLLLVVTVIPAVASPAISAISPATGPNTGDVTITITGTGFNAESSVWMSSCDAGSLINGTVVSWSPTSLTCRFSINGQTPGIFNVFVTSPFTDPFGNYIPAEGCELPQSFEIYQGTDTTHAASATPIKTTVATKVLTKKVTTTRYTPVTPQQTTVLTTETPAPVVPTITPRPTRSPTLTVTVKIPTSWPTDTPSEPSPWGIEPVIIAITGAALLLIKRK